MGISFGSINTGLPKDIVQQIMNAQRSPLKRMEGQKEKSNNKMKLLDELIGYMKELQTELDKNKTIKSFTELKPIFQNDIIDVTVDKNIANPGSYQIEVLQLAQKSSALSNGFSDPEKTYLGVGFFSYEFPDGREKRIYIDSDHSNLKGLAKLINNDEDNKMTAKVINDGSESERPWKLLLTFQETGDKNKIKFPNFYFIDGEEDFSLEKERRAQDAKIKLDGFEIETSGNKINDLIPGVTIDLKKMAPGQESSIHIKKDVQKISEKISLFIEKINSILNFINRQNSMDAKTDTSRTLGGDITLSNLSNRIKSILFKSYQTKEGSWRAGDIGITFQKNGLLDLNQEKFKSILNKEPSLVRDLMMGVIDEDGNQINGLIGTLSLGLKKALQVPNGLIANRKRGLQSRIDQIDNRIEQKERLLDQKEKNLKRKFAKLEQNINRIKSQGAGLQSLSKTAPIIPSLK
ncbi:MAG: flagellar filament capping protein FliD [Bacteriovoracales bacterium]|nr:flagellar filament capping protein FliD [Bacteriovoracales bacterium]